MSIYDLTVYRSKTLAKWAELWFSMNNDAFYRLYGFNFNPYKYPGLYELARERVHGAEQEVCRMQSGWTGV